MLVLTQRMLASAVGLGSRCRVWQGDERAGARVVTLETFSLTHAHRDKPFITAQLLRRPVIIGKNAPSCMEPPAELK